LILTFIESIFYIWKNNRPAVLMPLLVTLNPNHMSAAAKTIFYFSIYLVGLGLTLLIVPNMLLNLFQLPSTNEVWIRVIGMLVLTLAYYYWQAAKSDLVTFFRMTVTSRLTVILFFGAFVLLKMAGPTLILFGVVDLLGALWTRQALPKRKK
jgi:hypothetical protein